MMTMLTDPEMFQAVVDRIMEFYLAAAEIFYEATKGTIDAVLIGKDFGSQTGMMVAPKELRRFIFRGTKQLIEQAKGYDLRVIHHSCGTEHGDHTGMRVGLSRKSPVITPIDRHQWKSVKSVVKFLGCGDGSGRLRRSESRRTHHEAPLPESRL